MQQQAQALLALGPRAVLLKGGHARLAQAVDILALQDGRSERFAAPRAADEPPRHRLRARLRDRGPPGRRCGAAGGLRRRQGATSPSFSSARLNSGRTLVATQGVRGS